MQGMSGKREQRRNVPRRGLHGVGSGHAPADISRTFCFCVIEIENEGSALGAPRRLATVSPCLAPPRSAPPRLAPPQLLRLARPRRAPRRQSCSAFGVSGFSVRIQIIPEHALHEKGLQRQIGVGILVSRQQRRALAVQLMSRG